MGRKYVICDIDDTLGANPLFTELLPKENTCEAWQNYYADINYHKDFTINWNMVEIIKSLAPKYIILFVTSREDIPNGKITRNTLDSLNQMFEDKIVYKLYMRPYQDLRSSAEVKEDLFTIHGYNPEDIVIAFDDDISNIEMFSHYGINTSLVKLGDKHENI